MPLQFKNIAVGNLQDDVSGNNYAANKAVYILNLNNTLAQIFSDEAGTTPIVQDGVNNATNSKGVFGFWVEAGDYFVQIGANKYRVSITGADYFNNRVDDVTKDLQDQFNALAKNFNFTDAGFDFATGGTIETYNQLVKDASGNSWQWQGSLPHIVAAGTVPSSPDYEQRTFNEIANISGLRGELDSRTSYMTLAEAQASDLREGQYIVLTDYYRTIYECKNSATTPANGSNALDGGGGITLLSLGVTVGEKINALSFGIDANLPDNTDSFNAMVAALSDGDTVFWPKASTPYIGNFVTSKAISFESDGAVLQNFSDTEKILSIDSFVDNVSSYNVTEAELLYGDTTFSVPNASLLFNVGDIGYLWDSAFLPSTTSRVNFECVKIKSVVGSTVTVEGILHSHKGAGQIVFYHSTKQNKNVSVKGFHVHPTATHTAPCLFLQGIEGVVLEEYHAKGFTGPAARVDFCYDFSAAKIRPKNPVNVGSGQGYGLELRGVTSCVVKDLKGLGCRHVYDADSVYNWFVEDVEDMDDKSAPVNISHTGFCAHGTLNKVRVKTSQYPVTGNGTGYGQALKRNHPMRHVTITGIDSTVHESKTPNDSNVSGVYIRSNVEGLTIDDIKVKHANFATPTGVNDNNVVRIGGIATGQCRITNLNVDAAGRLVFSTGDSDTATAGNEVTVVEDCYGAYVWQPIRLQGSWRLSTDKLSFNTVGSGVIVMVEDLSGQPNLGSFIGDVIHYNGIDVALYEHLNNTVLPVGNLKGLSKSINSGISLTTNYQITQAQMQNRVNCTSLIPPDSNPITINSLPQPYFEGQQWSLFNTIGSTRGPITISSGAYNAQIVLQDDDIETKLIARGGVWRVSNR